MEPRSSTPPRVPASGDPRPPLEALDDARASIDACRACALWKDATRGVPGEGPRTARLMLVGEQPGDQEDLAGRPFVGPAGKMLDRALADAGILRERAFVTNAVKHFKHELRGKRRLHRKPVAGEIRACRWWLEQELTLVRAPLVVALGATAAQSLLGGPATISALRGRPLPFGERRTLWVTVHPSFLLRLPDADAREREYRAFVADLANAREWVEARG